MRPDVVTRHPGTEVTGVAAGAGAVTLALSNGTTLTADHVVFASGYRADLASVPYLAGVLDRVSVTDGSPDLTEGFETSLPGLYVTGFATTRDFGPYYGRNLSALRDRLSTDVERPVHLLWHDAELSRAQLGADLFDRIRRILDDVVAQDEGFGWDERFTYELR